MNDLTLRYSNVDEKKRNLTVKFIVTGLVAMLLIVTFMTAGGYYLLRAYGLDSMLDRVTTQIQGAVLRVERRTPRLVDETSIQNGPDLLLTHVGKQILAIAVVKKASLFGIDARVVWSSSDPMVLSADENAILTKIVKSNATSGTLFDRNFFSLDTWIQILNKNADPLLVLVPLQRKSGRTFGVAKLSLDVSRPLSGARNFGIRLFIFVLLGNIVLFFLLYQNFRSGIQTIEEQEQRLNEQITRLSNLLTINKSMQKSMKTASARAVELNEQFLRRVGADLHDGPAQMIGYAVLRLNKISSQEEFRELGNEFHAVKEALDESLNEIRGISSGLVLPELEDMTLEECLRKVVILHGAKSRSEVTQYYSELPDEIALPIKICAYRFLQEGLNNSRRHGQAENCKVSAHVMDDVLHLSLKDNGIGFRQSKLSAEGGHLGLMGLKDRIESLGGKFAINSELGVGTTLRLAVGLSDESLF